MITNMNRRDKIFPRRNEKYKLENVDLDFSKEMQEIIKRRIELGLDNPRKPQSFRRMTKAIKNSSDWKTLKEKLINSEIKEDRWK